MPAKRIRRLGEVLRDAALEDALISGAAQRDPRGPGGLPRRLDNRSGFLEDIGEVLIGEVQDVGSG